MTPTAEELFGQFDDEEVVGMASSVAGVEIETFVTGNDAAELEQSLHQEIVDLRSGVAEATEARSGSAPVERSASACVGECESETGREADCTNETCASLGCNALNQNDESSRDVVSGSDDQPPTELHLVVDDQTAQICDEVVADQACDASSEDASSEDAMDDADMLLIDEAVAGGSIQLHVEDEPTSGEIDFQAMLTRMKTN